MFNTTSVTLRYIHFATFSNVDDMKGAILFLDGIRCGMEFNWAAQTLELKEFHDFLQCVIQGMEEVHERQFITYD